MQQALEYAAMLDIPFVYSANGDAFLEHDRTRAAGDIETELALDAFPAPEALWQRFCKHKGIEGASERIVQQEYHDDGSGRIAPLLPADCCQPDRRSHRPGRKPHPAGDGHRHGKDLHRIPDHLAVVEGPHQTAHSSFLADRNILVDQTRINDFKPFGSAMTKITNRHRGQVLRDLPVALPGGHRHRGGQKNIYKEFSPDFFDLVIIDECHRGSADAESAWREILTYFSSATQIGMTATPKETRHVSNIHYFGDPDLHLLAASRGSRRVPGALQGGAHRL